MRKSTPITPTRVCLNTAGFNGHHLGFHNPSPWLLLSNLCFTITWFMECLAHQLQIAPSSREGASSWPFLKTEQPEREAPTRCLTSYRLSWSAQPADDPGCHLSEPQSTSNTTVCRETLNQGQFWLTYKCVIICLLYLLGQYPIKKRHRLYNIRYYDKCSFILTVFIVSAKMGSCIWD